MAAKEIAEFEMRRLREELAKKEEELHGLREVLGSALLHL